MSEFDREELCGGGNEAMFFMILAIRKETGRFSGGLVSIIITVSDEKERERSNRVKKNRR